MWVDHNLCSYNIFSSLLMTRKTDFKGGCGYPHHYSPRRWIMENSFLEKTIGNPHDNNRKKK